MPELVHPDELNISSLYRQANNLASRTSRAFQKDWYRSPLALPVQWHLWMDGGQRVISALYEAKTGWREGPNINPSFFLTPEHVDQVLADILEGKEYTASKPKSLGVILHIADEFNLADLAPEARAGAEFSHLRQQLISEPEALLADKKVNPETSAWRLLPYWGAESGSFNCTAIMLSSDRQEFLRQMRRYGDECNLPVRTVALCAPLEALAAAPIMASFDHGEAQILIYQYLKFTVLFAISARGELISARTLPHRGAQGLPANFAQVVVNMSINHNMTNAVVTHYAMGQTTQDTLVQELRAYCASQYKLRIETPQLEAIPALAQVPDHRPEFAIHDHAHLAEHFRIPVYKESATFSKLLGEWALQDFDRTQEEDQWYPTQLDLQVLKLASWVILLMLAGVVLLCGWGGLRAYQASQEPSWNLAEETAAASKKKLTGLSEEKKTLDYGENLFETQSRGWVLMEFLQMLIPDKPGQVRLEKMDYSITPGAADMAAKGKGKTPSERAGFIRQWRISGLSQREEFIELAKLNSQSGVHDFFKKFAEASGDSSFNPDLDTRAVSAQITKKNNETFNAAAKPQTASRDVSNFYPISFDILLAQNFSDRDPLALIKKKPALPTK